MQELLDLSAARAAAELQHSADECLIFQLVIGPQQDIEEPPADVTPVVAAFFTHYCMYEATPMKCLHQSIGFSCRDSSAIVVLLLCTGLAIAFDHRIQ